MFKKYMPEDSHDVDEDEFTQGILKMNTDLKEMQIRNVFQRIDEDDEGYITMHDVRTFLSREYPQSHIYSIWSHFSCHCFK